MVLVCRQMTLDDDPFAVRQLLLKHIERLPIRFNKIKEYIDAVPRLMKRTDTEYCYNNFWLCFDDDKLAGVLQGYDPAMYDPVKVSKVFFNEIGDRDFVNMYREWRKATAETNEIGIYALIHDLVVANGYSWDDVAPKLMISFIEEMDNRNYRSVLVDVLIQHKDTLEYVKSKGFRPVRVIGSETAVNNYVRLILDIQHGFNYSEYYDGTEIGNIDRSDRM
jgi:hypothetical protein